MTDFQLTPAEAALLLKPRRGSATSCVQCALLALVAKGHLSIEAKSGSFDRARLLRGDGDGAPLPDQHRVIKEAVFETGRDSASSIEVSASLRTAFGTDHGGYVHDHVAPLLIERGLLHRSNRKWLGLIPYIHYEPTIEGRRRARQIGGLLDELAQMRSLVRSDPHRARRLLEAAGVLVILSPQARAQAKKLRQLIGERGDGGGVLTDGGGSGDWQVGVDVGDLGSAADCLSLLDGVICAADFTAGDGGEGGSDGGDGGGGGD
jgi:hypothetical protein